MDLVCLLLLLHCTAVTVGQNCRDGEVNIIGTVTSTLIAGRLEICMSGQWYPIYDEFWTEEDVRLVCKEKGFPSKEAKACTHSCFGANYLVSGGYTRFLCSQADSFALCEREFTSGYSPNENAGIVCRKTCPGTISCPNTTSCPKTTSCPETETINTTLLQATNCTNTTSEVTQNRCGSAIGASLGVVCATLLFILVGVIIGWVWSQHCSKSKYRAQSSGIENPSYEPITTTTIQPPGPPVPLHSSVRPRDTPTTHISLQRERERVNECQIEDRERYEVPVPLMTRAQEGQ